MGYDDNLKAYERFLLKEGYYLGQIYAEGIVFGKVRQKEYVRIDYDRFNIDPSTLDPIPIGPGERVTASVQIVDREGRVLIGAQRGRGLVGYERTIYHFFYGISPARTRVYLDYTLGMPRGNLNTRAQDTGDFFGFYDGLQSPIYNPSIQTELFVPYNLDWGLTVHNPTKRSVLPMTQFLGERYFLSFLHEERPKDADVIAKILNGKIPVRLATIGRGIQPVSYQAGGVGTSWPSYPIPWDAVEMERMEQLPSPAGGS